MQLSGTLAVLWRRLQIYFAVSVRYNSERGVQRPLCFVNKCVVWSDRTSMNQPSVYVNGSAPGCIPVSTVS